MSERGSRAAMHYEIRVEGVLGSAWSAWFDGMRVTGGRRGHTTISGRVPDQAALHGLLTKVRDLGLVLVEVRRVDDDHDETFLRDSPPGSRPDGQGRQR